MEVFLTCEKWVNGLSERKVLWKNDVNMNLN